MNSTRNALLALLCLVLLAPAAEAQLRWGHFATDTEMLEVLSDTLFVAEGRIGDLDGAATFELDLGYSTSAPDVAAQYGWVSGQAEPFTLTYDPVGSEVTFALGGQTLVYTSAFDDFGVMFLRTRAVNDLSTVTLTGLILDSTPIPDSSGASGPDGLDILWITGTDLGQGFTLVGTATLYWTGTAPTQSRLGFQIKVARYGAVPTAGSSWGQVRQLYR